MKRFFFILLTHLISFSSLWAGEKEPLFRFIENKNQWDKNILFKAEIPSGAIFLEKTCITYNFLDMSILHRLHGGNHDKDRRNVPNINDLKMNGHAFKISFLNCNPSPSIESENPFDDYYNFYLGKDRSKWSSGVSCYSMVRYQEIYEGIDLLYYSKNDQLKYDFRILPGANASSIQFNYEGLSNMSLENGELNLYTTLGKIIDKKPYAYQIINRTKVEVPCDFVLQGTKVSFTFPRGYDKSKELIIDPVLIFSTYSGSTVDNFGYTATYDSDGFLYAGSSAFGVGYPVTVGAFQTSFQGGTPNFYLLGNDIAITKYDTANVPAKKRVYSTYLGGSQDELPHSLIVDNDNNLIIFGTTSSPDFPITNGAYDNTFAGGDSIIYMLGIAVEYVYGSDIFISKLNNTGTGLVASTYLGGSANDGLLALSDYIYDPKSPDSIYFFTSNLRYNYADEVRGEVEIDNNNNIYIASTTKSKDFPITTNSVQQNFAGGNFEAVVVKLNSNLSSLIWSTYLGGSGDDAAYSLELDSLNNIYVAGGTTSKDFTTTSGVKFPAPMGGRADGFITHLSGDGTTILQSTYFGSSTYDQIYLLDLDRFDNVYVFGQTMAPGNTFVFNAAYNNPGSGQFISKLKPDLSAYIWSTVFGNGSGIPNISPTAFLVDLCGRIYLSGWGGTPESNGFIFGPYLPFNMPLKAGPSPSDYFQSTTDNRDFYLFVLEGDASEIDYASYFGGPFSDEHVDGGTSRFDKKGKIYQAICAGCMACQTCQPHSDLPVNPIFPNNSYNCNCAVMKMDFKMPVVVAEFSAEPNCSGDVVSFTNKSLAQNATTYKWNFGDGSPISTDVNPTHIYTKGGTYAVTLIIADNQTCNFIDTLTKTLYISDIANLAIAATTDKDSIYSGQSTGLHGIPGTGYNYAWSPSGSLNNSSIPNPTATPDTTTTYTLQIIDSQVSKCSTAAKVKVVVTEIVCKEPYIFVPNAFTPDGDGKNDVLYVRSNNIATMYLTIYNRWGQKVFETRDQNVGWDGIYNSEKVDPGVFDYYLEVTCINDEHFLKKGNITLIR